MDIKKLTQEVLLKNMTPEQQLAVLESVTASVKEAKAVQKQKIAENVDLVLQALKRIEADMLKRVQDSASKVETRVNSIKDGKDGKDGLQGAKGEKGDRGFDGKNGRDGRDGKDGKDGLDGVDGVSVIDAHIDFDGSLIIALSDGRELNVGEVLPMDMAEKIKVIGNGGGTSQYVLDAIADLQTQINSIGGGGLSYKGSWNASTNTPTLTSSSGTNGWYYIVSVAGSTNLNGVTDWQPGDWAIFNGSTWQKIDQTNSVTSVAGRTGAVTLSNTDISGLGTIAAQAASNVAITGGSITGITDLAVADGGTGASTAAGARTNLGLVIGTDVLAPNGSAASLTSFPTLNQNTTGTAANVTGIVAVANGGTGASTASAALTNLGAYPASNPSGYTNNTGTVTSVAALTLGTTGTDVSSTVATGTTTPVITLNIPTASATNRGVLSSADWTTFNNKGSGTVTSVTGTSPIVSSGGNTPAISLAASYGDTQNPYASKTANFVLAAPNGSAGAPTFRAIVAADIPTLNQNTTGSAATVTGNATGSTFGFNSGYGSVATAYGCRAWVNFNGTGTVAIRASGNVSSITDNAVGNYTVNFTTAMPDASYCVCGSQYGYDYPSSNLANNVAIQSLASGSFRILTTGYTNAVGDFDQIYAAVFR